MTASMERLNLESVERLNYLIPCKLEDEDGHLKFIEDLKNHAKASLGVARVLSQLLFMLNADKEFDHETLLEAAIACIDDQDLKKLLCSLVEEKLLLDVFIKTNENYLLRQKKFKEDSEAEISEMLNFERNRYDQLAEMEPIPDLRWWYYTKEDDALLHLKLDHFLSMCEIIKENSTFDDIVGRLDLPERFLSIPSVLLKTAILRRIYRLKMLSRIKPYEQFLGKAISRIVLEQDIHKSKFYLTSLNNEVLEELHLLAKEYSLGEGEDILEGSLNHCNSILIKSRDLSCGIDEALAMFIKELKREVERQWFHDQAMGPVYFAAFKKLQNEMELNGESLDEQLYEYKGFEVRIHRDEDEDEDEHEHEHEEDEDEEVTEVLPIPSSYDLSLEDITWVLKVLDDTLAVDKGMRHAFYPHFISLPWNCQHQHPICSDGWEPAQQNIDFNWKRVDLLHQELLVKTSSSCLFFFEILRAMKLPQLTHVFQKISEGKGVEMMKFEHVDKKLKETGLIEIVGEFEKSKKNVLAHQSIVEFSKIGDSWQAIDLNQYHNLWKNLNDFAEAFCRAIKMKQDKHTVSWVKDWSRLNFVKKKLEDYQESYRRDSRLRDEDIVEMTKQKDAASHILADLFYVKMVHDSIAEAAKGKVDLKENPEAYFVETIQWLMYRNVATANLMRLESLKIV